MIFGAAESSTFLSKSTFFFTGLNMGEIAIMALPLLLIVMTGEIDLSVASMLGLSGTVMGYLYQHGWLDLAGHDRRAARRRRRRGAERLPDRPARAAVDRGDDRHADAVSRLAEIILTNPTTGFPDLADQDRCHRRSRAPSCPTPPPSSSCWRSSSGSCCTRPRSAVRLFAIGLQPEAAQFAGIRVNRIKFCLFVLSGVICAFAGILFTLKNASASYGAGTGLELNVVAIVLFGGVSIFGGRGTIVGVVLSVAIFGACSRR